MSTSSDQALAWHHHRSTELQQQACWSRHVAARRDRARAEALVARAQRLSQRAARRSQPAARPV